jgi:hypothetical protein
VALSIPPTVLLPTVTGHASSGALTARAQSTSGTGSLLATIGDDAVAPSLRATVSMDLWATPIAVPGGWFVPVLGGGSGYAVIDEVGGAPMATALASLGGLATFGPPVTRPFLTADGWIAQVMARAVIACEPPSSPGGVGTSGAIAATPDILRQAGLDDLLGAAGVPLGAAPPRSPVDAWHRLGWITDRFIRTAYLAPVAPFDHDAPGLADAPHSQEGYLPAAGATLPDLATLAGPPVSLVVTTGTWRRQRFERAIVEVDGSGQASQPSDATPAIVPVGLLLRRATSLPPEATIPDTLIGAQVVVRGPMASVGWRAGPPAGSVTETVPLPTPTPRPPDTTIRGPVATAPSSPAPQTETSSPSRPPPTSDALSRVPGAAVRIRSITAIGGAERVVVANDGTAAQDVGGWAVRTGTTSTAYRLPAGLRLDPGATVTLLSGRDAPAVAPAGSVTLARRSLWKDDGGSVLLIDRDGTVVDERTWP